MEYIKIQSEVDCIEADKLFNELVKYESGFDHIINGECKIDGFNKNVIDKSHVFAYYVKDKDIPVGYIFAYLKTPYNKVIKTNVIMVESFFVRSEYRKNGIGKALLELLESWAKETFDDYVVEIVCLSNNKNALDFYKNLGYEEVKVTLRK